MSILAVVLVLAMPQASPAPVRRPITEMDPFRFVWIGDPQISPDGAEGSLVPSFDGTQIHALVQKPPGFDASRRYPLILNIHGGPHAAYGHTLFHYPGDDHKDLMAGVDELIRRGYVDPSRLGITTQRPPLTNQ